MGMALQVSPVAHWLQSELLRPEFRSSVDVFRVCLHELRFPLDEFDNCFVSGASNDRTPEVLNSEIPSAYA